MGGIKTINMENLKDELKKLQELLNNPTPENEAMYQSCLLYTSPSPRD